MNGKYLARRTKRVIDVVFSGVGLVITSPLIGLIALLIKLDGTGGGVFSDEPERIGKDGVPFRMYKFRTMIPNAHELIRTEEGYKDLRARQEESGKLSIDEDVRITNVGTFLRRWDLDELPQLVNVFLGQMSIVGPRPYFREECRSYVAAMEKIRRVPPGITGFWQVSGRNDILLDKRIEMDMMYVEEWTLIKDLIILLKTPYVVIFRVGAR